MILQKFSKKTHEMEKILGPTGGRRAPLDPPLNMASPSYQENLFKIHKACNVTVFGGVVSMMLTLLVSDQGATPVEALTFKTHCVNFDLMNNVNSRLEMFFKKCEDMLSS